MKTVVQGTVINGSLQLDVPIALPDRSRVQVLIEPVLESGSDARTAWERMKQRIHQHPVRSGGLRFTRDELHERD